MITVRKSTLADLPKIEEIYSFARDFMVTTHNPHQWGNNHPLTSEIIKDIKTENHYIIEKEGDILGVFSLFLDPDPTYGHVDGKWLNDEEYATIHKIASSGKEKGVLLVAVNYGLSFKNNVRIDTHEENKVMQHLLEKYGFKKCGIIYLLNGDPRIAYQLKKKNLKM